ncbi:beta-galactosidase [Hydrogenophaga taeniospiralis CCUG 15921]|uniref:Beta-glucosidase n=1 Tax=Hydrogenophaga taeniospiralis CCUG 15921 TaxID=1281780 RepID=A0A9X4NTE9_9BURK|nr:GH1 family beta-glucosidase [Hydrogenophaga taeniospiralis]MDG5975789.1 beta-galactosidase [Hydrogenophaga taeniospiralis CCUG 15921]
MTDVLSFPSSFEWGCATAAFQIEGGAHEGGKLPSIWDDFCAQPGRIKDASDGLVACDHYHRYPEDVALMASLGLRHYRFSIAWTRVMDAQGRPNPAGLDFYRRLLDELQRHGITPNATLFHWDLPSHLEGGWLNRDTAQRFADYADLIARELGDRLPRVATLNEPWCSAFLGHDRGVFAPGLQDREASLVAAHHLMLAHGLAVQAWRAVRSDTALGIVLNPELCDPASAAAADVAAARLAELERNDVFLNPLFGREWPAEMLAQIGTRAHERRSEDLAICAQPLDFIGLNYYTRSVARAPASASETRRGYAIVPPTGAEHPLTDIGWEIYPSGLGRMVRKLCAQWPLPPIWITENGAADNTGVSQGECHDVMRTHYLQTHLAELSTLIEAGFDIRGYYVWSLLDNFEWAEGYSQRFGIVHVDYATQTRTPKHSARWLQALMQRSTGVAPKR